MSPQIKFLPERGEGSVRQKFIDVECRAFEKMFRILVYHFPVPDTKVMTG